MQRRLTITLLELCFPLDSPGLINPGLHLLTIIGGNAETYPSRFTTMEQHSDSDSFASILWRTPMTDRCSLFVVRGINRLQTQSQRSLNMPNSSQGISSCLHDAINMTISREECLDVASNVVTL